MKIERVFYFLRKQFGTKITYYQSDKAAVNYETGERVDTDKPFVVDAVSAPTDGYVIHLHKLLGRTEVTKTNFLVLLSTLPSDLNLEYDYFVSRGQTFRKLALERHNTVGILSGEAV